MTENFKKNYYLEASLRFFETNYEKRLKFLDTKNFLFSEISHFINNCIDNTKNTYIFCAGNSLISKNIKSYRVH